MQTLETLEAVLAAGQAILDTEKESEERERRILEARTNAIQETALTAAKGFLPAGVHAYMEAKIIDDVRCQLTIRIPDALPAFIFLGCQSSYARNDPELLIVENWYVETNRHHEHVTVWRDEEYDYQLFSGSLEELPKALLIAKSAYRPPVVEKPIVEPDPAAYVNLYDRLRADIESAVEHRKMGLEKLSHDKLAIVTAQALVDLAESLDCFRRNYFTKNF
jgi:hypothetical protein